MSKKKPAPERPTVPEAIATCRAAIIAEIQAKIPSNRLAGTLTSMVEAKLAELLIAFEAEGLR